MDMMVVVLLVFIGLFSALVNVVLAPRSKVPQQGKAKKTEETT